MGYDYAVTLDADGQHSPEEIRKLMDVVQAEGETKSIIAIGSRDLNADGMPTKNTFANRFSNFWFMLQTCRKLPDTQTGFRVYPMRALPNLALITNRYESELELLVFSAWRGVKLVPVSVSVEYAADRVTHFRPFWDFLRITLLNTILCFMAIVYGYPMMLFHLLKGGAK